MGTKYSLNRDTYDRKYHQLSTVNKVRVEMVLLPLLTQANEFLRLGTPTFISDGPEIKVPSLTSFGTARSFTRLVRNPAAKEVRRRPVGMERVSSSPHGIASNVSLCQV